MPKFSIIVPCYKEIFLKECIESILSQTYQDFELILVNDASPYNIKQIVEQFKDDRIRYYERKQGFGARGLVQNWNDCLQYVCGEYVINMGDDDKLMPNCLSDYIDLMKKYPGLDLYHTRVAFIDEGMERLSNCSEKQQNTSRSMLSCGLVSMAVATRLLVISSIVQRL